MLFLQFALLILLLGFSAYFSMVEAAITTLIEKTQKKLEAGDRAQEERLSVLLSARKQMDRHVPPRLVLENLYLKLESPFKKIEAL
jgi:Mg2+/Co2+ transporter CorB